ncbi:medium chain dehydrogenase/reductase family protein [Allokutzneria multivorans]|uniref:Medium chain dehydrogenase/reductase family protein n=1 Tax=Allokutzneria multivorans TaxID=1142134 RepID=A0ABP7R4B6_9PSEU
MEIVLTGKGGPEMLRVTEGAKPSPGKGRLLVRTEATGVSFAEVQMLRGRYPLQPKFPFVPGYDLVGRVVGTDQRVVALTRTGAWRDEVVIPAKIAVPISEDVDPGMVAAVAMNGVTAWEMLHVTAKVRAGQTVLVHGAAGGVGSLLVQLARLAGARVIGTASVGKHELLRSLGAEPVDYRKGDVGAQVRALAPNGVDAVFDHVGGKSLDESWSLLAPGGVLANYGSAGTLHDTGHPLRPYVGTVRRLAWWQLRRLVGLTGGRRASMYYVKPGAGFAKALTEVLRLVASGSLTPHIDRRMPLANAAEALTLLSTGQATGKIVLEA